MAAGSTAACHGQLTGMCDVGYTKNFRNSSGSLAMLVAILLLDGHFTSDQQKKEPRARAAAGLEGRVMKQRQRDGPRG